MSLGDKQRTKQAHHYSMVHLDCQCYVWPSLLISLMSLEQIQRWKAKSKVEDQMAQTEE